MTENEKIGYFFASIKKTAFGCWEWMGVTDGSGYGIILGDKATRFSFRLHKGEIEKGLLIRHSCHNPSCVNPEHLSTGTHQDNSDDMTKANRQAKGELLHRKLTNIRVLSIKDGIENNVKFEIIAERHDVSVRIISLISQGLCWGWLTGFKRQRKKRPQSSGKLNVSKVLLIKKDLSNGYKILEIMKKYEISKSCASRIRKGETWEWVK